MALKGSTEHHKSVGMTREWTAEFSRLALVNRSFSNASLGILWKEMDSLDPFLHLILLQGNAGIVRTCRHTFHSPS